jgi:hypothetical protein
LGGIVSVVECEPIWTAAPDKTIVVVEAAALLVTATLQFKVPGTDGTNITPSGLTSSRIFFHGSGILSGQKSCPLSRLLLGTRNMFHLKFKMIFAHGDALEPPSNEDFEDPATGLALVGVLSGDT